MVDGWLNTGDTYREDPDGYLVYEGRSDDMLKVGGIWCSPIEIESCLITHPAVLEAAVVGQADADQLIKPKAIVVLKQAGGGGEPDRRADGALQEEPRALQVSALDRVRRRAAQDGDRQDPALQAARLTVTIRPFEPGRPGGVLRDLPGDRLRGRRRLAPLSRPEADGAHLPGPYAILEPSLALVVEDGLGVAGFAVGTADTVAWEERLERDWWPLLRPALCRSRRRAAGRANARPAPCLHDPSPGARRRPT